MLKYIGLMFILYFRGKYSESRVEETLRSPRATYRTPCPGRLWNAFRVVFSANRSQNAWQLLTSSGHFSFPNRGANKEAFLVPFERRRVSDAGRREGRSRW